MKDTFVVNCPDPSLVCLPHSIISSSDRSQERWHFSLCEKDRTFFRGDFYAQRAVPRNACDPAAAVQLLEVAV